MTRTLAEPTLLAVPGSLIWDRTVAVLDDQGPGRGARAHPHHEDDPGRGPCCQEVPGAPDRAPIALRWGGAGPRRRSGDRQELGPLRQVIHQNHVLGSVWPMVAYGDGVGQLLPSFHWVRRRRLVHGEVGRQGPHLR